MSANEFWQMAYLITLHNTGNPATANESATTALEHYQHAFQCDAPTNDVH